MSVEPQWEACKVCGGDHWTKDHPRFDWHDSQCSGMETTGFDGHPLTMPCDCAMPEMFRSAYESGVRASLDVERLMSALRAVPRVVAIVGHSRDAAIAIAAEYARLTDKDEEHE